MCALSADPHVMPVLSGYGRVGTRQPASVYAVGAGGPTPAGGRAGGGGGQWPGEQRVAADSS